MGTFADRVLPVLGVAALVGALVLGVGSLRDRTGADEHPSAPAARPAADVSVTDLDLQATTEDDVAACISPGFATDAAEVDVLYGVRQSRLGGSSSAVLVLRNSAGDLRLCDRFGADGPSQAPLPTASASRPVAFLSTGQAAWTCVGGSRVLDRFERSTWLVVSPDVATVEQRYIVGGVPGPWFRTQAHGGYAHLQTWLEGPEPAGTSYAEQYRVQDADGDVVPQTALPTRPSRLPGCRAGGSAEIG